MNDQVDAGRAAFAARRARSPIDATAARASADPTNAAESGPRDTLAAGGARYKTMHPTKETS